MSIYELVDYDALLRRIGIPDQQDWRCGANEPERWRYDQENLTYDDVYTDPTWDKGQPFNASYDGRALGHAGLCLTSDINVNGLLLNHRDANNTIWICTGIEGWWTLPPAELNDVPRGYWDGSMLTTGRYTMRTVTITGCFMPPDPSMVWYNRDLLLRVSSIVRGIGLLAVCGNSSEPINSFTVTPEGEHPYFDPFHDPSKMIIIQTADVPLIDTTKPNGFTQFSLSFRCVYPAKLSVAERIQIIPFPVGGKLNYRKYSAFDSPVPHPTPDNPADQTTQYFELLSTKVIGVERKYSDVRVYNPSTRIIDEDTQLAEVTDETLNLVNKGNYFAFPVYVFDPMTWPSTYVDENGVTQTVQNQDKYLEVYNTATGESMRIIKEIPPEKQLIVDTGSRRATLIIRNSTDPLVPNNDRDPQVWDWNARDYLSLDSSWVALAAGSNRLLVFGYASIHGNNPAAYWRDTWIA